MCTLFTARAAATSRNLPPRVHRAGCRPPALSRPDAWGRSDAPGVARFLHDLKSRDGSRAQHGRQPIQHERRGALDLTPPVLIGDAHLEHAVSGERPVVARSMAGPTAVRHAKATLPGDSGTSRTQRGDRGRQQLMQWFHGRRRAGACRGAGQCIIVRRAPRPRLRLAAAGRPAHVGRFPVPGRTGRRRRAAARRRRPCRHASSAPRDAKRRPLVLGRHPDAAVIGADTVVVVDGAILGKPARRSSTPQRMLRRLSGQSHEVLTGVAVHANGRRLGAVERTVVWFLSLSDCRHRLVRRSSGEPRGQGRCLRACRGWRRGSSTRIEGSYSQRGGPADRVRVRAAEPDPCCRARWQPIALRPDRTPGGLTGATRLTGYSGIRLKSRERTYEAQGSEDRGHGDGSRARTVGAAVVDAARRAPSTTSTSTR